MTDITIYISANNGEEVLVLPLPPKDLPDIVSDWGHEELETNDYTLTLIGKKKRRKMSLELLLPVYKHYRLANKMASENGMDYINFWEKWSKAGVPMRLIICEGAVEVLNIAYTIDSMKWHYDKKKDIIANLDISEYIFTYIPASETKEDVYTWVNIYIEYEGVSYPMQAANVRGRYILQVRRLLTIIGYEVSWDADTKKICYMGEDNVQKVIESEYEVYNGISYAYLFELCGELGLNAAAEGDTVMLTRDEKAV